MPFLADLAHNGVRGELASTMPAVSPTAWTTIATGRHPGNHGIFDFIRSEERGDRVYFTLYDARDINAETVWSMASRLGLRVTVLNYMLTFPPPPMNGYLAPGLVSWRHLRRGMVPTSLYDTVRELLGPAWREMAWDFNLEKKAIRGVSPDEHEPWIQLHRRRERHWYELARHLVQTDPCDLTAVVFDGVDKVQHACWRFLDPDLAPGLRTPHERRIRNLCLGYFREVDGYVADLVRLAGPDTQVFVVSDHGFGATREVFRVNAWLHRRGLLEWAPTDAGDEVSRQSVERRLDSNFAHLDWTRTRAYAQTPSCNGVVLRAERSGPAEEGYLALRQEIADGLLTVRSPLTGRPVVRRVLTREEAFAGKRMSDAPDLYLELVDHGFVSIRNAEPVVEQRPEVSGTHRPNGIFLAAGPGLRRGGEIRDLSVVDVAPALLHSLGVKPSGDLDGRLPVEIFEPSWLDANPAAVLAGSSDSRHWHRPWSGDGPDREGEAAILRRLEALGAIE
jgi:predicted AlkP superfamily phosphohydrolase/phosphomutase